jgi:hypothetical protein
MCKKIFKLLSVVLLTVVVYSCTEGDNPVDKVLNDTVIGGGSLRTITIVSPTIALGDPAGKFQVTLEVQDAQNGAATVTDNTATIPTVTQLRIGSDGINYASAWVQKIMYWPQRLINAEVQAFSK